MFSLDNEHSHCCSMRYSVKKTRWESAGFRMINFAIDRSKAAATVLQTNSKGTDIVSPIGLPSDSQPSPASRQMPAKATQSSRQPVRGANAPTYGGSVVRPSLPSGPPPQLPNQRAPQSVGVPQVSHQGLPNRSANRSDTSIHSNPQGLRSSQSVGQLTGSATQLNARPAFGSNSSIPNGAQGGVRLPFAGSAGNVNAGAQSVSGSQNAINRLPQAVGSNGQLASVPARPKPPAPPPSRPKVAQCRALYDYRAQEADELTLAVGDVITIVSKDSEGWWTGLSKGKKGLFPANYVEMI